MFRTGFVFYLWRTTTGSVVRVRLHYNETTLPPMFLSSLNKIVLFSVPANIFHDSLPVTLATRSTSAILDCEAYGYPKPSVMWYSSGRELSDRTKYQQLTNGSLEIMDVREEDAGEYECTASNELGRKTVKRKLQIRSEYLNLG